ncbi:Adenosylmethionine-8-amino-7-oxononanoate aminotransferase [Brevibacterium siliguriense]|uniref:Adenosylmethionine-8-amino-7-oxononanoate aminotransferase n=1 Tax=Brevibacterium siliguriense TaxID=1136497 RepID=A0A1H1QAW1_9MICO|nr:aspartate aminotransferase family protein [Brevibacterium siliguriense]SDS20540.1 Adenosylmethionine-8-amino-7-oxononanoate aminotransferase [Brevibacterium siliguriense]
MKTKAQTSVFHRDLVNTPKMVSHADGVHVWDADGNQYLDASSGGNVVISIGYGVEKVIDAMTEQARKVSFCGAFTSEPQEALAQQLAEFAPNGLDKVRFVSGGSEANETAIKLARHYHVESGNSEKYKIVGRWRSYHGNTLGALSATGHVLRRKNYLPMLLPFPHAAPPYQYRCQFCSERSSCTLQCADDVERLILNEGPESVAAFIAEPIVGAAAMGMVADPKYFSRVREICDKYDVLLIVDEVLSGMGRTGANFAIEHWNTRPDIITCGKGISSGYTPLGAVITTNEIHDAVRIGSGAFEHGFTYGGNPLSCAVGSAVLTYIQDNKLVENAATVGSYLQERVAQEIGGLDIVGEVSGKGMLCGIEIVADRETKEPFSPEIAIATRIARRTQELGVLINPSFSGNVDGYRGDRFGICPPLTFTREQVDETVDALGRAVREVREQVRFE